MAKSDSNKSYGTIGIVFAGVGVVTLLLGLLDYLQDGKAESSVLLAGVIGTLLGLFLYASGKRPKTEDK